MLPYLLRPGPRGPTDEALVRDLMFVSHVPESFLAPSITFIATLVIAGPLLGALSPVLGNRRSSRFWDPLKLWSFEQLDVIPVPLPVIGWRVGRVFLIRNKLITLMLTTKSFLHAAPSPDRMLSHSHEFGHPTMLSTHLPNFHRTCWERELFERLFPKTALLMAPLA
jgi:hypothetical protein